jgi:hypothetical protein
MAEDCPNCGAEPIRVTRGIDLWQCGTGRDGWKRLSVSLTCRANAAEARYNELAAAVWAVPLDELADDRHTHAETLAEIERDVMEAAAGRTNLARLQEIQGKLRGADG